MGCGSRDECEKVYVRVLRFRFGNGIYFLGYSLYLEVEGIVYS